MADTESGRFLTGKRKRKDGKKKHRYKKGDKVNLSELLFTKDRDYLIKYNDRNSPVQAKDMEGKVVVLHFVNLVRWTSSLRLYVTSLVDIYESIQPKGGLEVVFVGVTVDTGLSNPKKSTPQETFQKILSIVPWTAIPFADFKSRRYLARRFPVSRFIGWSNTVSVVIDPTGKVLQCPAEDDFLRYGAPAYPFSDERIGCLVDEDEEALKYPTITKLLTSPECDYVINKNKQVVPVHNLEDKVVALYFYEDFPTDDLTGKLKMAYDQLANKENFEIVFVYVHDSSYSCKRASEKSYWKNFNSMPWLAIPYKDNRCKKLQRVFNYYLALEDDDQDTRLVIIGPQGKFVEPCGADIIKEFGISAYPFTRNRVAELEADYIRKLKLDMFWDSNTSFKQQNGPKVHLSQLVGKRIILTVEGWGHAIDAKFWKRLKARYVQMKDTNDEFEVIQLPYRKQKTSSGKHVASMPWLRHPPFQAGSSQSKLLNHLFKEGVGLLAFDRDGRVVRRTIFPWIRRDNTDFPFHDGGLEEEAVMGLAHRFKWEDWDDDESDDDDPVNIYRW